MRVASDEIEIANDDNYNGTSELEVREALNSLLESDPARFRCIP